MREHLEAASAAGPERAGRIAVGRRGQKCVFVDSVDREGVPVAYDYLILATGARHSYFGHDEFEQFAPGLKNLADAVAARNKILQACEYAEAEEDPRRHRDLLTFVLVGAGATGVEMAGALAVLVRSTLRSEFRRIDPASARIALIDMASRVPGAFADDLSRAAKERLEQLGVEVRLGHGVDQIDADGVIVGGDRIPEQDRDLDRGRGSVARRQVAEGGDGSRRAAPFRGGRSDQGWLEGAAVNRVANRLWPRPSAGTARIS